MKFYGGLRGDNLRQETRLIKEILKSKYPDKKFKFQYRTPRQYIDTSDKLVVTCERYMDIDDVVSTLKKYTRYIGVYKKGTIASIWSRTIESQIFSISENKFVDCDLLEFIEVRNE